MVPLGLATVLLYVPHRGIRIKPLLVANTLFCCYLTLSLLLLSFEEPDNLHLELLFLRHGW